MSPSHSGRLTPTDASFLYLERDEAPMHIGALCLFDGELPFERYRQDLATKLTRLPRFRELVVPTPLYVGHPTWETDPDFELDRHLFLHRLERADEPSLRALVNRLIATRLERDRPLWELHVIHGLAGGASAIVSKVHHAMVDGVGGNAILTTIMDLEREPPPREPGSEYLPTTPMRQRERVTQALWDSAQARVDAWSGFLRSVTEIGRNYDPERSQTVLAVLGETVPGLLRPPQRLPFNRRCSAERALYWTDFSFAEARALRGKLGGTVNDVMLSALAGALSRYAAKHGMSTSRRTARVMVPVNVRAGDASADLGNQVSVLPVHVPLGIDDPVRRLKVIRGATRTLKEGRFAEGMRILNGLGGAVPAPLQAAMGAIARTPFPPFNLVCTNVPGPQIPLYAAGQRLDAYYPHVPVGFHMGVSCAIFSYNQRLFLGINSDVAACPDAALLTRLLDQSFAEMKELAGVASQQPVVLGAPARKTHKARSRRRSSGRKKARKPARGASRTRARVQKGTAETTRKPRKTKQSKKSQKVATSRDKAAPKAARSRAQAKTKTRAGAKKKA